MAEKIIIISYFSLNYISIILAFIILSFIVFGILYLWLYYIKINHNNYCTPLMMYVFGEKMCNKLIYKTVDDEFKSKLDSSYIEIKNNMDELKKQDEIHKEINLKKTKDVINNKVAYQALLIETGNTVNNIKDAVRQINNALIQNMQQVKDLNTYISVVINNFVGKLKELLSILTHQINMSYITPSLYKLTNPLLKLYSAVAEMAKQPKTPKLKVNVKTDLSATLEKSKSLLRVM